ncbi:hypothetical protein NKDENANG_00285 [Candidatus Entotheonellaceae bacterium PAL068K]
MFPPGRLHAVVRPDRYVRMFAPFLSPLKPCRRSEKIDSDFDYLTNLFSLRCSHLLDPNPDSFQGLYNNSTNLLIDLVASWR